MVIQPFEFDSLNIYKVTGDQNRKQNLMPLSYGIRPEQDTSNYYKVYSKSIENPKYGFSESSGDVKVNYMPNKIKTHQGIIDDGHNNHPLEIDLPRVTGKEGYVMVQTFKVTNLNKFRDTWSAYYLSNGERHTGSYQKGNYNWALGTGTGKEIPKFYSQRIKLINKKYVPGSFKIKKLNEADNKPLQGAIFELRNKEGDTLNRLSGSDGIVEFKDLEPGIYTLQEIQAPDNFIKSNKRWQVIVYDTGYVIIQELGLTGAVYEGKDTILIPVTNKSVGEDFKIYKKNSEGTVLQGAIFKITKQGDKNFSQEKESDDKGIVTFEKLDKGTYIIEEIEAPLGYKKLDKKWVLVIDDKGKKVYNYREQSSGGSSLNSIVEKADTNWVDVAGRSLDGWNLYDNRRADWTGNYPTPFKLGTRIVAINKKENYVIQRYVINPESKSIGATSATIHREKLEYTNMDWYDGKGKPNVDYQVYELNKPVTGSIADIRLAEYKPANITGQVTASKDVTHFRQPARLKLDFPKTDKPLVVDIKVPYKNPYGGIGTGMDWTENGMTYWKSDFYESVNIIKESGPVLEQSTGIQGSYISDDYLDVTNEAKTYGFKIKKVKEDDKNQVIKGAEFKLTGPDKKSKERFMTTDSDGMLSFDKLKPGTYTLEENIPAPGYELSNVKWKVRITEDGRVFISQNAPTSRSTGSNEPNAHVSVPNNQPNPAPQPAQASRQAFEFRSAMLRSANISEEDDMGLEIGENIISNPVRAESDWEAVDPNKSEGRTTKKHSDNNIATKITEINKQDDRFRQIFLFKPGKKNFAGKIEIHREPEPGNDLYLKLGTKVISTVNFYEVDASSTIDNITGKREIRITPRQERNGNGPMRIKSTLQANKTILVEVESSYANDKTIGLGADYVYDTKEIHSTKKINSWAGDSYPSEDMVNKNTQVLHKVIIDPNIQNGTVTANKYEAKNDEVITLTVTPKEGYELANLTVAGIDATQAGKKGTVTVRMANRDINVTATFREVQTYPINIDPNIKNGKVTSDKPRAKNGESFTLTITPDPGYILQNIWVNNSPMNQYVNNGELSIEMGTYPADVTASFVRDPNKAILSFAPNGGSGTMKKQVVDKGRYQIPNCSFTPPAGKVFRTWTISGYEYAPGTYATIDGDYTFTAQWKDAPVTLTSIRVNSTRHKTDYKVGEALDVTNLTIEATMSNGSKQTILVTSDMVSGFDSNQPATNKPLTITYQGKTTTYNINISQVSKTYKIKQIPNIKYGRIEIPSEAEERTPVTVTVIPNPNYKLKSLTVTDQNGKNPVSVDENNTFTMPAYDVYVNAVFEPDNQPEKPEFNITTEADGEGSVTIEGNKTKAKEGEEIVVIVKPNSDDYEVGQVTANGDPVRLENGKYSFKMPAKPVKVRATFSKKKTYDIGYSIDQNRGKINVKRQASAGENVVFTIDAFQGWQVKKGSLSVKYAKGGKAINFNFDGKTGSFTMPAAAVSMNVIFETEEVPVGSSTVYSAADMKNGKVVAEPRIAKKGEKVRLSIIPDQGYKNSYYEVKTGNGIVQKILTDENGPYFFMPGEDVTIYASFDWISKPGTLPITIATGIEHGSVSANVSAANAGDTIYLSNTPEPGYALDKYIVKDAEGNDVPVAGNTFTMPAKGATVSASFTGAEIEIKEGSFAEITNQQTGIELKIFKKNTADLGLIGAVFELKKDDGTDTIIAKAESDKDGNVKFVDKNGIPIKLKVGTYLLTETKSPAGYKKPAAPWKLEVKEEGGQLVIKQSGPKHTSTSFLSSDGAQAGNNLNTSESIKYKSIIKNIDPVNKTFIQRIYVDTRGYKGSDKINVQIVPTTKREEIDTPGAPPKTTSGGVKTAYRTTYKISDPDPNLMVDDVLKDYDLRKSNVSVVNTARWRPFDWGFDEDQINLSNDGVYYIDIEGFYDDNIKDLKEIELKLDFYGGERIFAQRTFENGKLGWKYDADIGVDKEGNQVKRDAAYQQGMEALRDYYYTKHTKADTETWFYGNADNKKYAVWLRKGTTIEGTYYPAGQIVLASDPTNPNNKANTTPIQTSYTKANIKDLYSSDKVSKVPQEGMTITNEDETYNITFSKHAKQKDDPSKEDYNKNRLEGAVFKLQKREGSFWYDVDDSYVASAFNGYFGFRRLEPGRYILLEVTPPEGYKPIEGPLLEFTIKQIDTRSGKIINPQTKKEVPLMKLTIIDPYNQEKIALKDAKAKIKGDSTIYEFKDLIAENKVDLDTCIILSTVKDDEGQYKEIPLKGANFIDPDTNKSMGQIIAGAQGFISLEYKEGGYVTEYGKAGSSGGALVDYVTAATAKNMGKIMNEKPGKGKVTIKKLDEKGNALGATADSAGELTVGAKFEAIRTSGKKDKYGKPLADAKYSGTVDENGVLKITGLPIGNYELKEVENPSGHINTGQIWHFTVGGKDLDPYAGEIERTGNDLSDKITITKSDLKVIRPSEEDRKLTEKSEGNKVIRPHVGQSLEFDNEFKLDPNMEIKPGDYFVLKLSDNIDLEGVKTDGATNLDLFADGVGTIAKAEYNKEKGTITYTFTKYADQYKLLNIQNKLSAHITFSKVRNSVKNAKVGLSVGKSSKDHEIEIKYVVDTITESYDGATVNLASKIVKYNTKTGEFVHYFYVNRDRTYNAKDMYFRYTPSIDVEDLQFTYYRLWYNSDDYINQSMPESFDVNEDDWNLYRAGGTNPENVNGNTSKTYNIGNLGPRGSMIIKVTGRMKKDANTKVLSYKGFSRLYSTYLYEYDYWGRYIGPHVGIAPYVDRWDAIYEFENTNTASADLTISAVNPTNKIQFRKVDPQGQTIKPDVDKEGNLIIENDVVKGAAYFSLYKNGGSAEQPNETWDPIGNANNVDKDGLIAYSKLGEGYYKLVETISPSGFIKPTDPVAYFKVDKTGKIYNKVSRVKENGQSEDVFEEVEGEIPINIINYKPIKFEKVDGIDKTKKLKDAEFKVLYKDKENSTYSDYKVGEKVLTVKSGENGEFKLELLKPGYYALKETKAPAGYAKIPGYIKEFKLDNGKFHVLEKSIEKISHRSSTKGQMTSEILSVNKEKGEFTQRIVINPNHGDLKVQDNNSSLNILENGWSIIPRVENGIGGQVRVALIKKNDNKKISDLKTEEYKPYGAIGGGYASQSSSYFVYEYGLKEMLGLKTDSSSITTTDTLVIEYTGKLNNINQVDQKLVAELSDSNKDSIDYKLDADKLAENKPTYIDMNQDETIEVENHKAEYPFTKSVGTVIFTAIGLFFMVLGGFYYSRKKSKGLEIGNN